MSRSLAGQAATPAGNLREAIDRVSQLWDLECRYLLGQLSRAEYRQALAVLRADALSDRPRPGASSAAVAWK